MSRLKDFKNKIENKNKKLQILIVDEETGELISEITKISQEEIKEILNKQGVNNESNEIQPDISDNIFSKWKTFH